MILAMAHSFFGHDRKPGRMSRGHVLRSAVCLLAALPILAACDTLLDATGLEREPQQDVASLPPAETKSDPASPAQPRKKDHRNSVISAEVVNIQELLNGLGYDPGPADGIMGPRTKTAIRQFQVDANLPVDGRASPELSAALQREYDVRMGEDEAASKEESAESDGAGSMPDNVAAATPPSEPARPGLYSMAQEPHYEAGDNYIYSNGRIETATRTADGLVHWVANDGSRYTAVNSFVMPPVDWENGSGSVQSTVVSSSTVKWPPAIAGEMVFVAQPTDPGAARHLHESWSGEWTCGTEGRSTMTVPAGRFDVLKIACEKLPDSSSGWSRRVWYYAPDIRHFVRKEETRPAGANPEVIDLIAVRPGRSAWTRSARSGFDWAIQKLLDGGAIGQSIEWKVADNGAEFDITLTGQIDAAGSVVCRRYVVVRKKPGQPRSFPALACRDGVSGRWMLPGLEKGSVLPEDVLAAR